jgi:DNA/RNA-binding domain of Phe-tRNA-synthetase-like protein
MTMPFMAIPLLSVYNTRAPAQSPGANTLVSLEDCMVIVEPHPLLDVGTFVTHHASLGESPDWLRALLSPSAEAPLHSDDKVRGAVRDLLRANGYKPTGRGKPASEYLLKAEALPIINIAVDCGNAVSLHSGLPISVVDVDRTRGALRIGVGKPGESYVFNSTGQVIDVAGIPCLYDEDGPCANAVKDAQRTKTNADSRNILSIIWGTRALGDRTARTVDWYRSLLAKLGGTLSSL